MGAYGVSFWNVIENYPIQGIFQMQLGTRKVENDLQKSYYDALDVAYSSTFPKCHRLLQVIFADSKVEVL